MAMLYRNSLGFCNRYDYGIMQSRYIVVLISFIELRYLISMKVTTLKMLI